jgi:hypothetical protein
LASALQAMKAAHAEARSNPQKFTECPVEAAGEVEEIKQLARMIDRRINNL